MKILFSICAILLISLGLNACAPSRQENATGVPGAPTLIATAQTGQAGSQPVPRATSRGDKLEASPPASVKFGAGRPVFVEFFRFTWTTCQAMAPMVHGLEASYFGQIDFFFLDADDPATQNYQQKLGFQYQPYFVLLNKDGNEVKRWTGAVSKADFETEFSDILK